MIPESMFYVVQSPMPFNQPKGSPASAFLAGGIPGMDEDWHQRLIDLLYAGGEPMTVVNPKREHWDPADQMMQRNQIDWEFGALATATVTAFWFPRCDPAVTVQPTALVELAEQLAYRRPVVIGCHPGYPHRDIVEHRARLYGHRVHNRMEVVAERLVQFARVYREVQGPR